MNYLRQATSVDVAIGPFVDQTDGFTAETALTLTQPDIRLKKNGGNWAQKAAAQTLSHEENGWYELTLDATDTDTVGILMVAVNESGALPVWREFQVIEEAVYDALFAAASPGYVANAPVNVAQISGDATAADNLETVLDDTAGAVPWVGIADQGTAQAATSTTIQLRSAATFGDNTPVGMTVMAFGSTQGYWQSRLITGYVGSTDTATVDAWGVTPSGTITYKVLATAPSSGGGAGLDAAGVRAAIGMASANMDTQLSGIQSDTDNIQTRLPAALVSGRMDSSVGAMANNVMTAAAAAADLTTELQAGLSTLDAAGVRSAVGLASANLDTQLSGIQADTDNIQTRIPAALVSGRMDASVGAMANNVMTAAAAAADLTTELQSGLATSAALATTDGKVDSLVSGIIFGAAASGTLSTTQATTNLAGYANDQLIGRVIIWLTGNCRGEATDITDYASAGGLLTFTALTTTPANGDTFKIV